MEVRSIQELLDFSLALIDKPQGPSSHEVSAYVKKILGAKRAGHSGTLDPQVSGLLLVGVGRGTRFLHFLRGLPKEYVGVMKFHKKLTEEQIRRKFKDFTGEISQMPPLQSAVRRRERKRKVYYLAPAQISNHTVLFQVRCEAGTYIRTLCADMGRDSGGAHMCELRRTSIGDFPVAQAHTLQELSDAVFAFKKNQNESHLREILLPPERFLSGFKRITARENSKKAVCSGSPLYQPGVKSQDAGISPGETVAIMDEKGRLLAMGLAPLKEEERRKGIAAYPRFVATPIQKT